VKITELIGTLSETLRHIGDAEVCVQIAETSDALITSVSTAQNIEVPERGRVNVVILHGTVPEAP
jgi:hypothetical protein